MKRLLLLAFLSGVLIFRAASIQSQDGYIRARNLGLTHISAPNDPDADMRYGNALLLGAGWNRWPLYWGMVEPTSGNYNWTAYDVLVANDVRYGLNTDAIFLGIPGHKQDGGSIRGIYQAVFSDGSDHPAIGKSINPNNPYARFVYEAVMRYKPGGVLANLQGWQAHQGIRSWEAWNEPDLRMFWSGSVQDYARVLKVTYLAVQLADPLAQVIFGGLAYNNPEVGDYLSRTLALISQDPDREAYNWYFDIAAVHSYSSARRSGQMVQRVKDVLASYDLERPIWLNESGMPVWDDYPGQTWTAGDPSARNFRATMREQALYMIQSTALAWASGAEVVFIHQLYDDCGNQPGGTDFPPDTFQAGDAYGLFRNPSHSSCFSQSQQPNTPRPAAAAFYRMAQIFGSRQIMGGTILDLGGQGRVVALDLAPTQGVATFGPVTSSDSSNIVERAYILWNRSPDRLVVEIPASGASAALYDMGDDDYTLDPQEGRYEIGLPAVNPGDYPQLPSYEIPGISGAPFILIEPVQRGWTPIDPQLVRIQGSGVTAVVDLATEEAEALVIPTLAVPTLAPTVQPTTDPALDTLPPIPLMQALPVVSPPIFTVYWGGQDNSGIASYIVWVRVNGGDWVNWLETTDTSADYLGSAGNTYEFALWAVDLAGNWSQNIELSPQAVTAVQ